MMDLRSYGFTGVNLENIMHGASVSANRRGQQRRVVFRHQTKALKVAYMMTGGVLFFP